MRIIKQHIATSLLFQVLQHVPPCVNIRGPQYLQEFNREDTDKKFHRQCSLHACMHAFPIEPKFLYWLPSFEK